MSAGGAAAATAGWQGGGAAVTAVATLDLSVFEAPAAGVLKGGDAKRALAHLGQPHAFATPAEAVEHFKEASLHGAFKIRISSGGGSVKPVVDAHDTVHSTTYALTFPDTIDAAKGNNQKSITIFSKACQKLRHKVAGAASVCRRVWICCDMRALLPRCAHAYSHSHTRTRTHHDITQRRCVCYSRAVMFGYVVTCSSAHCWHVARTLILTHSHAHALTATQHSAGACAMAVPSCLDML
jgi:hypothetical protein